ncbi:MAG: hypothetical protein CVU56_14545 [Deltaproteobacteria bacterium HGW-Deltaproteobacteria-14]|jgi:hypothetical protein|nr:MAG: hypothetical protein CVU56_14545 [Deltaproteobacteria bacterium HGW-Deltaproteobacteria-14]
MAWLFSLSVECGPNPDAAERLGPALLARVEVPARLRTFNDAAGGAWVSLIVEDIDEEDIDAVEALADRLRLVLATTSLPFRFGLAGIEVDEVRTWPELVEDIGEGALFGGVVLHSAQWKALGAPPGFAPLGDHRVSTGRDT